MSSHFTSAVHSLLHELPSSVISFDTAHRRHVDKAVTLSYFSCIALVGIDNLHRPLVSVILEAGSTHQRNTQHRPYWQHNQQHCCRLSDWRYGHRYVIRCCLGVSRVSPTEQIVSSLHTNTRTCTHTHHSLLSAHLHFTQYSHNRIHLSYS